MGPEEKVCVPPLAVPQKGRGCIGSIKWQEKQLVLATWQQMEERKGDREGKTALGT